MLKRWIRFHIVGAMGALVQTAMLCLLTRAPGLDYLTATALSVEAAILHNFAWHALWTFRGRKPQARSFAARDAPGSGLLPVSRSFLRFQLQAGLISVPGNMLVVWLLAGQLGAPVLLAGAVAIVTCSTANFVLANRFSFPPGDGRTA